MQIEKAKNGLNLKNSERFEVPRPHRHPAKSIHTLKKQFSSAGDNVPHYGLSDTYRKEIS